MSEIYTSFCALITGSCWSAPQKALYDQSGTQSNAH